MFINKYLIPFVFVGAASVVNASDALPAQSHEISYPAGWQDWSTIAVSHRTDNKTLRVILGNKVAVEAARLGETNPWPNGAILGKVVWKDTELSNWKSATVPDKLIHTEFMFKGADKYSGTNGWGWARWLGVNQKPFNQGAQVCISCHTPVKNRDWVYTEAAEFPRLQ